MKNAYRIKHGGRLVCEVADHVSSATVKRIARAIARHNPTLVHHGLTKGAAYHLTSTLSGPIADVYVASPMVARAIAQLVSNGLNEQVEVTRNTLVGKGSVHSRVDARRPRGRASIPSRNPASDPRAGEVWTTLDGSKARVLAVNAVRVQVLHTDTGVRDWITRGDFFASYRAPRVRTNPSRSKAARAERAYKRKKALLPRRAYRARAAGHTVKDRYFTQRTLSRLSARTAAAQARRDREDGRRPNPSLWPAPGDPVRLVGTRHTGRALHWHIHQENDPAKNRKVVVVHWRRPVPAGVNPGNPVSEVDPGQLVRPDDPDPNPKGRKQSRGKRNPGGRDPRTHGYPDIGTPAVGTITVKGTRYTVHRMASKYTPWYLVGPRGAQFGLLRYAEKPWLFYAMNAARPMGSVGKLEGVTFTGETFEQFGEFTGRTHNPTRRKSSRPARRAKRNPGGELERAKRTAKMWNEFDATGARKVKVRSRVIPRHLVKLGDLDSVVYRSNKYGGKPKLYEHRFKRPLPVLTSDPDGRAMHIVGGGYKITGDGLVN